MGRTYYRVLLLRAIRDRRVTGWESLKHFQREYGLRFIKWGSSRLREPPAVISLLQDLQRAGLAIVAGVGWERRIWVRTDSFTAAPDGVIVYDPEDNDSPSPPPALAISIDISPQWRDIQDTLGLSLGSLAELQRPRAMVVTPEGLLESQEEQRYTQVFVVMPFRAELRPVYDDHIVPVCDQLSLSISRADDFFAAHAVMADVWGAIKDAKLVIADCTDRNPNVFYEIGLAHVLGKQVVLISQNAEDISFDLRHLRYITYEYTPRGMRNFEGTLKATLEATIDVGG